MAASNNFLAVRKVMICDKHFLQNGGCKNIKRTWLKRRLPTLNLPKKSHQSATTGKCRSGICQDLSLYCSKKKEHMDVQTVFQ